MSRHRSERLGDLGIVANYNLRQALTSRQALSTTPKA